MTANILFILNLSNGDETVRGFLRAVFLLGAACWIIVAPNPGSAELKVVAEPETDPAHVEMVQKTVNAFNESLRVDMGITLDRNVKVFICPTRESYRQVLQRELGQSSADAERISKVSGGFSSGQSNAVAVYVDRSGGLTASSRAYKTTAHELFHQVQYQLAANKMGKSFYWMKEGTADLVGAVVAEKVGYQSLDKWKLDQVNTLKKAETHVSPQEILITNLDQWTTLMEKKQYPYEMSDLMVFYLMQQTGTDGYRAIANYYRLIGQGTTNDEAFERAFGITSSKLVAGFWGWFVENSVQSARIEVIAAPDVPAAWLDDFNRGAELSRQYFIDYWGRDIYSSMRFILTTGKQAYAAAMMKEFGISAADAEQRAQSSVWWYIGSTTVYDTNTLTTKRQRVHVIANSLIRRFAQETAPQQQLEDLLWLVNGVADVVASRIVERSGAYTMDQYRNAWITTLGREAVLPGLAELSTAPSWKQAKAKYGTEAVNRTAALAGWYLLEKHSPAAFNKWCKAVKETGSAEIAFQQVYGMTTAQFYEEFSSYLARTVKRAS